VAIVRELAGDPHPVEVSGAVKGTIGCSCVVRPMQLMSDSVLHISDNRIAALPEIARADTGLAW
jgi:hypothetical protein